MQCHCSDSCLLLLVSLTELHCGKGVLRYLDTLFDTLQHYSCWTFVASQGALQSHVTSVCDEQTTGRSTGLIRHLKNLAIRALSHNLLNSDQLCRETLAFPGQRGRDTHTQLCLLAHGLRAAWAGVAPEGRTHTTVETGSQHIRRCRAGSSSCDRTTASGKQGVACDLNTRKSEPDGRRLRR